MDYICLAEMKTRPNDISMWQVLVEPGKINALIETQKFVLIH